MGIAMTITDMVITMSMTTDMVITKSILIATEIMDIILRTVTDTVDIMPMSTVTEIATILNTAMMNTEHDHSQALYTSTGSWFCVGCTTIAHR
jgi:hypothetical protein